LSEYKNDAGGTVGMWKVACDGVRYQCARQLGGIGMLLIGGPVASAASMQPTACTPY
jgi:hypothetical protein